MVLVEPMLLSSRAMAEQAQELSTGRPVMVWSNRKRRWLSDGVVVKADAEIVTVQFDESISMKDVKRKHVSQVLRLMAWSISQSYNVGVTPNGAIRSARPPVLMLDEAQVTGVRAAVEKLNSGEIECPNGICCVKSQSCHACFLVWRWDRAAEANPLKYCDGLAASDDGACCPATSSLSNRFLGDVQQNYSGLSLQELVRDCRPMPLAKALAGILEPDHSFFADVAEIASQEHLLQKYPKTSEE